MLKNCNKSKIIGIQFSILSPDEIRKASVANITSKDTYINNKPVIGGLFDPRMGVLEPGLICPTDGLDFMKTPGYFGHIELASPVYYIQHVNTIVKCLRCVCFKCSKLLISKHKHNFNTEKMTSEEKWKYVCNETNKVKRCGNETEDGCGYLQPKFKKEGIANIYAEWANMSNNTEMNNGENYIIKVKPKMVLTIFKRISDDDVSFMGFSPIWSRPDWMICQVMAVPPPAVRPSVKHDAQQRSEDDLTHIMVNIMKINKKLQDKIQENAPANEIDNWTTVLQYHVATQVDNKTSSVMVANGQRSGRPYKDIKTRLNGKHGRLRGNLMGKRVDFSARSVITADPNISIVQIGVPLRIAKSITTPVTVNKLNKAFLTKLIINGPDVWPGAKTLEKKNGEYITLRYFDRDSIVLEDGDIVHRHMMDGDDVIFNRQPTLHRMSMMGHRAKIMFRGDTFRMNVADTKPYNADFDGDEMNLHMPQDPESAAEIRYLAAVPYQIISPANNSPIIGIYQDSMLGSYLFTKENVTFTPREAMELLMMFNNVNINLLKEKDANVNASNISKISNYDILSQILPPLSLKYTTNAFNKDKDDFEKSKTAVLEIKNGTYIRGQMTKDVLGAGTKGLIQRTCNDFGNMSSTKFIDDLQNIITEYMKTRGFSVGISDIILSKAVNEEIVQTVNKHYMEVKNITDQVLIGVFENSSGQSNQDEFETQIKNILNQTASDSGKIGIKNLSPNNRFNVMVKAGSKGSELNITLMTSCLGQQTVDNKRIPYGFESRTLPHFCKYDESPQARGFIESSYINGLKPAELFFHAMAGRIGLIDTAVKTSETGYIQRRLIKGLEDLMVAYDMTVRTNKNKIVQFRYGDDNINPIKVENQSIPIVTMTVQEIFSHYFVPLDSTKILNNIYTKSALARHKSQLQEINAKCNTYTTMMLEQREKIVKHVFKNKESKNVVNCPVAFQYIINNVQGQMNFTNTSMVDITFLEAFQMIEECYNNLEKLHYSAPTELLKTLYYYYLSPKELLVVKRFNKNALTLLLSAITLSYKQSIVSPGEMVGIIAGQSIGEVSTQMTLNTFHFAGVASKSNVTRGVPRMQELLSLTEEIKNPSLTVYLKPEDQSSKETATKFMHMITHTSLEDIVDSIEICFDPDDSNTLVEEDKELIEQYRIFNNLIDESNEDNENDNKSKWIIRMVMDPETMFEKNITMDDVNFTLKNCYKDIISCVFSDYNSDKLVFRIRMNEVVNHSKNTKMKKSLDQTDQIYVLQSFQEELLKNVVLRGVKGIDQVVLRKIKDNFVEQNGSFKTSDMWVLDTVGSNLVDILGLDYIDNTRTFSNNVVEIYDVLGIEAARQAIYNEFVDVIEYDGNYINYHHYCVLADRMTFTHKLISIYRHGINNDNIGPIAKATFEETPEMFLKAARHGELDTLRGVSANIMCGQEGFYGTSAFQVVLDIEKMQEIQETSEYKNINENAEIERFLGSIDDPNDVCSIKNLEIRNNVGNIKSKIVKNVDDDNDYNPGF